TAAMYAAGAGAAIVLDRRTKGAARPIVAYALGAIGGMAGKAGPWVWGMEQRFANPGFSYLNDIFPSPWWDPGQLEQGVYRPETLREWRTLPFRLMQRNSLLDQPGSRDPRLAFICLTSVIFLVHPLFRRWTASQVPETRTVILAEPRRLLVVFCV